MLPLPLLGWNLAGWLMSGREGLWWRWLIDAWPYASHSVYGSGPLLTMVAQLPVIVSPLIVPATIIGTVLSLRKSADESEHLRRCRAMTALIPLFVLTNQYMFKDNVHGINQQPRNTVILKGVWVER